MKKIAVCSLILALTTFSAIAAPQQTIQQNYIQQAFNSINISGGINVDISGSPAKNSYIKVKGDPDSMRYALIANKGDTLYIGMHPGYNVKNGRLSVFINAPQLTKINYSGSGQVTANKLQGPLDIYAVGSGNLKLNGVIALQNLTYSGSGAIEIYWVNSNNLKITGAGTGKIYLAGVANFIEANLSQHTWLDAKQLHASKITINTIDNARADIWAKDNLTTLAEDHSNIYFYYDAKFIGGYMKPPATVLRMTGVNTN